METKKKTTENKKKHDKKNQPTPTVEAALSIDIGGCKVSIEKRRLWLASNDGAETMADHPPTPTHRPTHRPGDQSETSCRPIINHRDNDPDTLFRFLLFSSLAIGRILFFVYVYYDRCSGRYDCDDRYCVTPSSLRPKTRPIRDRSRRQFKKNAKQKRNDVAPSWHRLSFWTQSYWVFLYRVSPFFFRLKDGTEFYRVLPSFTEF